MRDSKLYRWLEKMPAAEQNDFLQFLEIRAGKNRRELSLMLKSLIDLVQSAATCSREAFHASVFGDLPFDPNALRKRMTAIKSLLDDFLAITELLNNASAKSVWRLKALQNRGWQEFIESEYQGASDLLAGSKIAPNHFGYAMQLEESYLHLVLEAPRRGKEASFQRILDQTDLNFLVQKLRFACAAANQDRIVGTSHDFGLLQPILGHVAANEAHFPPLVRMYFHIYCLQRNAKEAGHFQAIITDLQAYLPSLETALARELCQFAINHCVARVNDGEHTFRAEIQRLYQWTLETKVLLVDEKIDGSALKNMVAVVLLSGDCDLAERLLKVYGPLLNADSDPTILEHNKAIILYHRKQFSAARKICDLVIRDARDMFIIVDARVCLWRSSFELGDLEFCLTQYDVFRMFLGRVHSMSKEHIARYKRFANGFHALVRICSKYGGTQTGKRNGELKDLLARLETSLPMANLQWLLQKTKEALEGKVPASAP